MAKQIQIKIQNPCHERWSEMSPTEQGAFCKSCQKNVIDFTNKTENEIYRIVTNAGGKGCGRFYAQQIENPILKTEINNSFFNWKAIAAGLAAILSMKEISARSHRPGVVYTSPQFYGDTASIPFPLHKEQEEDTTGVTITGVVLNGYTKDPVSNADVQIENTEYQTKCDKDGSFTLTVPRYLMRGKILKVTSPWLGTKTFELKSINPHKKLKVLLNEVMVLGMFG